MVIVMVIDDYLAIEVHFLVNVGECWWMLVNLRLVDPPSSVPQSEQVWKLAEPLEVSVGQESLGSETLGNVETWLRCWESAQL